MAAWVPPANARQQTNRDMGKPAPAMHPMTKTRLIAVPGGSERESTGTGLCRLSGYRQRNGKARAAARLGGCVDVPAMQIDDGTAYR